MNTLLWLDTEVLNKTFIGLNHSGDNGWQRENTNVLTHTVHPLQVLMPAVVQILAIYM